MKYFILFVTVICFAFSCNSDVPAAQTTTATTSENSTATKITYKETPGDAENPDIYCEIKNMPSGKAYLVGTFTGQNYRADSAMVDASGKLRFKKNEPYRAGMYFVVLPDGSNLQLLIDKDQTLEIKTDAADILSTIEVKGQLDTELLYRNVKFETEFNYIANNVKQQLKQTAEGSPQYGPLKAKEEELIAQRKAHLDEIFNAHPNSFFTSFKRAGQNPTPKKIFNKDGSKNDALVVYYYRTEFWDDVDFNDTRLLYTPVISNKLKKYIEQLTPQNPDSINQAASFLVDQTLGHPEYLKYFANYITLKYEPTKTDLMDSEKVYVHMIQKYFTKDVAFWADTVTTHGLQLRAYEMSASLTGKKGPDVEAKDPNGKLQSIYDIKSDYIVVYLFNPTCEHCMIESPKLVEFYKTWKNKGVEVFAIGIDTNDQEWRDYIKKTGMTWINVFDPTNRSIYAKYYVDITPEIYVLNKDRIIIGKNIKVDQISTIIERDKGN